MATDPNKPTRLEMTQDGQVSFEAYPTVTEREVYDDRNSIVLRLHTTYLAVDEAMQPYQVAWDANWVIALRNAMKQGAWDGLGEWGGDFAEIFEGDICWGCIGDKISESAGTAIDMLEREAAVQTRNIEARFQQLIDNPEQASKEAGDQLRQLWSWVKDLPAVATDVAEQKLNDVKRAYQGASETVEKAKKIYKHREAILNLPDQLLAGDSIPIQNFIDVVLADIDPELAKSIRNEPGLYVVLELVDDHDSILSYMAYLTLTLEAIPPNFYVYAAGKGGAYLLVELVLYFLTALFSAGLATAALVAARVTALVARFTLTAVKLEKTAQKAMQFTKALQTFVRLIEDYVDIARRLHRLGDKLHSARSREIAIKGSTKTTLSVKKEGIKREKGICKYCKSKQHATPHGRPGTVEYE